MRLSSVIFEGGDGIDERKALALAIQEAVGDDVETHVDEQWRQLKIAIAIGAVLAVLGIGLVATGQSSIGAASIVAGAVSGGGGSAYIRSRSPDATVQAVEKGYWTGHLVPDKGGTVVFDATESVESREFQLNLLENPDRAATVKQELENLQEFPVVMTDETNVEEQFVDRLSMLESEIENSESYELRSPVLEQDDPAVETLSRLASVADAEPVEAGGVSLSREAATQQVEKFKDLESMADEDHGESVLLDVSDQSRQLVNDLSSHQETATELLNDHIQTAGDMFGLITYHFYCADCMEDDIESRLEVVDRDGQWYCETCRSNFEPGQGVPRHRIRDDIVHDVWDQLWIEKDDQKRQVYESIEDQKAELEEREFEQKREEIRTAEERIKDTRSKIRDLQTEAKAKEGIVDEIGKLMKKYERLNEKKVNKFQNDVASAFDDIDAETERVLEETEEVVQGRIEEAEEEAKEKAKVMREEERQRHREQLAAQAAVAAKIDQQTEAIEKSNEIASSQAKIDASNAKINASNAKINASNTIANSHRNKPDRRGK